MNERKHLCRNPKLNQRPLWPHLRYATLSDVREELPATFGAWAIMSAISVGIGLGVNWLTPFMTPTAATWKSPLPYWANYAIVGSIALWFLRGKTIHYRFPILGFGGWLAMSLYLAALIFAIANSPWWIGVPLLWGNFLLESMLDTLDAQGKENFEAFNAARAAPG